ncbi:hypothetical protein [Amycolatopsis sp.]|uniref:hypothetical protein n=1 Tax=Amycolatopsis sp. TaxID=37632 RepID=UPI002D7FCF51|nr:hypothetical protein [Amycolatopsis sp.]HET6710913.1 hypothetical protein [Amycolatopsis sp.]
MAEDSARLMRKALKYWRSATETSPPSNAARFMRAANRAETALFRLIRSVPDDPAPRVAYGEVAMSRSSLLVQVPGRLTASGSVGAARGALWALDRAELAGTDAWRIAALAANPPVATEFVREEGKRGLLFAEDVVVAAAEARFVLAERLATLQPRARDDLVTPGTIDATFRAQGKVLGGDESLVWRCQTESCRGQDGAGEARILAAEAARVFLALAELGGRFGPEDAAEAERRRAAVLSRLPLGFD